MSLSVCATEERKRPTVASLPFSIGGKDSDEPESKKIKAKFVTTALPKVAEYFDDKTNDELYGIGSIKFCPVFKALLDTPQMQRLKGLKQLATADYVYKDCTHVRFQHSVGVAHLAEQMCKNLQEGQPNLNITRKDVLCVKLAGLLHDLGHGPYSHVYEEIVNKRIHLYLDKNPHLLKEYEGLPSLPEDFHWKHEEASLMMLDAALESLGLAIDMDNLDAPLLQIGDGVEAESMCVHSPCAAKADPKDILTSRDFVFIKECILGKPIRPSPVDNERSGFVGRPHVHQEFLYDIVSNRHSGLDVDKIDYFARDSKHAFPLKVEIFPRMMEEAVVAWGECPRPSECHACDEHNPKKHLMICYKSKISTSEELKEFFGTRLKLHRRVYTHETTVGATLMVCDILAKADPYFRIRTYRESDPFSKSDVPSLPISRAMLHPTSYHNLDDGVIAQIAGTDRPELREARLIIERFKARDLYKHAATKEIRLDRPNEAAMWRLTEDEISQDLLALNGQHMDKNGSPIFLQEEDFIVEKCKIHCGAGENDPVSFVRFLKDKSEEQKLINPIEDLPIACTKAVDISGDASRMQSQSIRVFCRRGDEKRDLVAHVFELWVSEHHDECLITDGCESDIDMGDDGLRDSVPLTQEEEECSVGSPHRGGTRNEMTDDEPSPFPVARRR